MQKRSLGLAIAALAALTALAFPLKAIACDAHDNVQQTTKIALTTITFRAYLGEESVEITVTRQRDGSYAAGGGNAFQVYDLEMTAGKLLVKFNGKTVATYDMATGKIVRINTKGVEERVQAHSIMPEKKQGFTIY